MVGGVLTAVTVIENAGSAVLATPSLTEIAMPDCVPAWALLGVPERRPVAALKLAQAGLLAIEKVSVWPSGSVAVGVKEYALPAVTDVGAAPLMAGGVLTATTVIENGASGVEACPSLALITIPEYVPACENAGVPLTVPVAVSKLAQAGSRSTANCSGWPSWIGRRRTEPVRLAGVHGRGRDAPDGGRAVGLRGDVDAERRERDRGRAVTDRDLYPGIVGRGTGRRDAAQQARAGVERGPGRLAADPEQQGIAVGVAGRGHEAVQLTLDDGRRR